MNFVDIIQSYFLSRRTSVNDSRDCYSYWKPLSVEFTNPHGEPGLENCANELRCKTVNRKIVPSKRNGRWKLCECKQSADTYFVSYLLYPIKKTFRLSSLFHFYEKSAVRRSVAGFLLPFRTRVFSDEWGRRANLSRNLRKIYYSGILFCEPTIKIPNPIDERPGSCKRANDQKVVKIEICRRLIYERHEHPVTFSQIYVCMQRKKFSVKKSWVS